MPIVLTPIQRRDEGAGPYSSASGAGCFFTRKVGSPVRWWTPAPIHSTIWRAMSSPLRLAFRQLPAEAVLAVYPASHDLLPASALSRSPAATPHFQRAPALVEACLIHLRSVDAFQMQFDVAELDGVAVDDPGNTVELARPGLHASDRGGKAEKGSGKASVAWK